MSAEIKAVIAELIRKLLPMIQHAANPREKTFKELYEESLNEAEKTLKEVEELLKESKE